MKQRNNFCRIRVKIFQKTLTFNPIKLNYNPIPTSRRLLKIEKQNAWVTQYHFCLMLSISINSSMFALAKSESKSLAGEITISGHNFNGGESSVTLNGENVFSGRTFFSSGIIATNNTAATVRLGKLGYLNLTPNSVLSLNFSENNISGLLSAGEVEVFNTEGVKVNIEKSENASVVNGNRQTTAGSTNKYVIPLLIVAGVVSIIAIIALTSGDDDDVVSPVR